MTRTKSSSTTKPEVPDVEMADTRVVDIPPDDPSPAPAPVSPRPRRRPPAAAAAPLDLDPQFIEHPARMQYALLLALLMRSKGTVRFSAKDMEPVDTDYNVVFSRTRDGKYLEVSVVSSESGIIRSPEREAAKQWQNNPQPPATYQPLPQPIPFPTTARSPEELKEDQLQWVLSQQSGSGPLSNEIGPAPAPQPKTAMEQAEQFLAEKTKVAAPKDGSASYAFPFEIGTAPSTATADLSLLQSRLLSRDRQIAAEELEAIARVESSR